MAGGMLRLHAALTELITRGRSSWSGSPLSYWTTKDFGHEFFGKTIKEIQ